MSDRINDIEHRLNTLASAMSSLIDVSRVESKTDVEMFKQMGEFIKEISRRCDKLIHDVHVNRAATALVMQRNGATFADYEELMERAENVVSLAEGASTKKDANEVSDQSLEELMENIKAMAGGAKR